MATISPSDGPVAVTGSSGYIGSWIVHDLLDQGYDVRACVRDASNPAKVDHLLALNNDPALRGRVELVEGDLKKPGSYDDAFAGCGGVIHAGAAVGYNNETPQEIYDIGYTENDHVINSVRKSGSVKRFVFTSSFAAMGYPAGDGYIFSERDWFPGNKDEIATSPLREQIPNNPGIAYAFAKAESELMAYSAAADDGGFEAMSILPIHVVGPVMCENHDQFNSWQFWIYHMMKGTQYQKSAGGRMLWNLVDVRDVARAHRLCLESHKAGNGSRYVLAGANRSYELFTRQLQAKLAELYPGHDVGGEEMDGDQPAQRTDDSPRSYSLRAIDELGLVQHSVEDTLRANVDSYIRLGKL